MYRFANECWRLLIVVAVLISLYIYERVLRPVWVRLSPKFLVDGQEQTEYGRWLSDDSAERYTVSQEELV